MSAEKTGLTFNDRMRLRIWKEFNRHRRCPECGQKDYGTAALRWENDPIALMLGIASKGCPCCGKGAVDGGAS